jgi:hypothetical protein
MYMSSSEHSYTFTQRIGAKRGKTRQNWAKNALAGLWPGWTGLCAGPAGSRPGRPGARPAARPDMCLRGIPLGVIFLILPQLPHLHGRRPQHLHHDLGTSHHKNLPKLHHTIDRAPWNISTEGFGPSPTSLGIFGVLGFQALPRVLLAPLIKEDNVFG